MVSRPLVSLASVLVVLLSAQGALAQRRPGGSSAFDRGVAALEAGRYNDAVGDLEEAVRVEPTPLAIYNLGLAYRGVGRSADAVAAFERYLAAPERRANPAVLTAVRQEVEGLRARLALLVIETDPADATVTVDGHPPPDVRRGVSLDAGSHQVEVSAPGRRTQRQAVALRAGARERVNVRLVAEGSMATPTAAPAARADGWSQLIQAGVRDESGESAEALTRRRAEEAREDADREAALRRHREIRNHVRVLVYGELGMTTSSRLMYAFQYDVPSTELSTSTQLLFGGASIGIRYSISDRWDFQVRTGFSAFSSTALVQCSGGGTCSYEGFFETGSVSNVSASSLLIAWRSDASFRVRPASVTSPFYLGFGITAALYGNWATASYLRTRAVATCGTCNPVRFGSPTTTQFNYSDSTVSVGIGALLEFGFVFGAIEQFDIGLRVAPELAFGRDTLFSLPTSLSFGWAFR